jgi:serine/threonine protein kinase
LNLSSETAIQYGDRIITLLGSLRPHRPYASATQFGLVFEIPKNTPSWVTLQAVLSDKHLAQATLCSSLDNRTKLAKALVLTLHEFHAANWVHKSLNSDNIIFFQPLEGNPLSIDWGRPYIVGFDVSRAATTTSTGQGPSDKYEPYTHPERLAVDVRFRQYHDIYSIGVVLLEIGRGESFLGARWVDQWTKTRRNPDKFKTILLQKAYELRARLGPIYSEAVRDCLSFPFGRVPTDNDEYEDRDDIALLHFQSQVCEKLRQMRV